MPPSYRQAWYKGGFQPMAGLHPLPQCQSVQGLYPLSRGDTECNSSAAVVCWGTTIPRNHSCNHNLPAAGEGRPHPASRGNRCRSNWPGLQGLTAPYPGQQGRPLSRARLTPVSWPGQSLAHRCQPTPVLLLHARSCSNCAGPQHRLAPPGASAAHLARVGGSNDCSP